jgi:hypothetical protein
MNKISLLASIIIISLLASLGSCIEPEYDIVGCGDIVEKRIYVPEFNAIVTSSSAGIVVTKGESLQAILSDYENLVDFWELRVENNILFIRTDPFSALVNSKAKLRIVLPGELYEAKVSGSGNMYVHAEDTLLALIAGSGDITYSGNPVLDVQMSGSGRVRHE